MRLFREFSRRITSYRYLSLTQWHTMCAYNYHLAPVYLLMRQALDDTVLQIPSPHDGPGSNDEATIVPVPKGSMVRLTFK